VLQERKVDPVGSTRSIDVDVRVIAATNKDLAEEVRAGRFREDLFYRLQVVPVTLPALRDRGSDVKLLATYFLSRQSEDAGRALSFSPAALDSMAAYRWPGNVRELENVVERMAILSDSEVIEASQLPEYVLEDKATPALLMNEVILPETGVDFNALVDSYESKLITSALQQTGGNKKAAAKLLGLNRTTLVEKIKKKSLESRIEVIVTSDEESERMPSFVTPSSLLSARE
jgi:DNA-binding NtrC family response regulator